MIQVSHLYMTTGKTTALTIQPFVGKMMSLLFSMLCKFVIAFLPRSKHLLIAWLWSPYAVILEPKKIKSVWMASPVQWTWIWTSSGSWWWTGKPSVLHTVHGVAKSQTQLSNWTDWTDIYYGGYREVKSQPWCQISCHLFQEKYPIISGFPAGSVVKNPLANAGDAGVVVLIPESKRCPGGEYHNPL